MMRRSLQVTILATLLATGSNTVCAQDTPERNPFARPTDAKSAAAAREPRIPRTARVAAPKFSVSATVVAGENSVANLDGVVVVLGETLDGYRLAEVHRDKIVLEKSGQHFTLRVGR